MKRILISILIIFAAQLTSAAAAESENINSSSKFSPESSINTSSAKKDKTKKKLSQKKKKQEDKQEEKQVSERDLKLIKEKEEDKFLLRKEIMSYVKKNKDREAGEGLLYLANHYKELNKPRRSLDYIKRILKAETVSPLIKWEAMLLKAEIQNDNKEYDNAQKTLKKLINSKPARAYEIKAKILSAEIQSRDLTDVEDLYKALHNYFKHFPEQQDIESIQYLIGFSEGYDLEIAMRAMEAWEELMELPESGPADRANMQLALLYGFDLNSPERAISFLDKIKSESEEIGREAKFIKAILNHLYLRDDAPLKKTYSETLKDYAEYSSKTTDLMGWRISVLMQSYLLQDKLADYENAVAVVQTLQKIPPHLVASASVSLEKRQAEFDEQVDWSVLACKIAGYICEYKLKNPDDALGFYKEAEERLNTRHKKQEDHVIKRAIKRTQPTESPQNHLYNMAYEKYRSRDYKESLKLYEQFLKEYPEGMLSREASFRSAVICDDDLRDYDKALRLYEEYIVNNAPIKSTWNLDTIYDWSRIDEVRYRIGNLLANHQKKPIDALEVFDMLLDIYPESYWAQQGLKDSINIYLNTLKDSTAAHELMLEYIKRYPDHKKSGEYRLILYDTYLKADEGVKALHMMRSWLDHTLPSEKDYFTNKQKWRDLAFTIREEAIRKNLDDLGKLDKVTAYQGLIDVVCLASTTAPLEDLIQEIKSSEIEDNNRWMLVYEAGTRLYQEDPEKAEIVFSELSETSSGTAQLACYLTLGNIAYRVKKSIPDAIKFYEKASSMMPLTSPENEVPTYRLGRLYLADGNGLKGMKQLIEFTHRYPESKYIGKSFIALGDACTALHNSERAHRFYKKALRVMPESMDEINKKLDALKEAETSEEWLEDQKSSRSGENKNTANPEKGTSDSKELTALGDTSKLTDKDLEKLPAETVYKVFLQENEKTKPDFKKLRMFLNNILMRSGADKALLEKAGRHYISVTFFRNKNLEAIEKDIPEILRKHNYDSWQSELLYRLALAYLEGKKFQEANKAFFEYLSFYENGIRKVEVRQRIPETYEKLKDLKNAYRFYEKIISDPNVSDEIRANTSIKKAKAEIKDEKKNEAIRTLEASLSFESDRRPEIALRLEKLTDDFSYVERALEYDGKEKYRFKALKRVIKQYEKDNKIEEAAQLLSDSLNYFKDPDSLVYIENKTKDLGKRGVISNIEDLIDRYPEDDRTAERMFRLAKLLEGSTSENYRSEDLFYEITLVYPMSPYFRESKIRSENTRAIKAAEELTNMLKKDSKQEAAEEIIIEKARLLKENLKDVKGALESYKNFIELFPDSKYAGEVYLSLGELILSEERNSEKALEYWETGINKTNDNFTRESLVEHITDLKKFNTKIYSYPEKRNKEETYEEIFKVWRINRNYVFALGLINNAINNLDFKFDVSRLIYYKGRIYEEMGNTAKAAESYEKALRNLTDKGCRKDMLLYRLARLYAAENDIKEAAKWYTALVNRYPKSLLSRSALYWLSKYYEEQEKFKPAWRYLDNLLNFRAIHPVHKKALLERFKKIEAKMNISEMKRLKAMSETGGTDLPYFIGKVIENDLGDYDEAIKQYELYLSESPSKERSRDVMIKIADLYEQKGDYVKTVVYLDKLLDTMVPTAANFEIILRIGGLLEDKIKNEELTELFYDSIAAEYIHVRNVRLYAVEKLKRIYEKKHEEKAKQVVKKAIKRVYSEEDKKILEEIKALKEKYLDELTDPKQYERKLEDLWNDNSKSLATLDIMKELVSVCKKELMDPSKASIYYERWLEENPGDPMYTEITLKLYEHYMKDMRDGQKALRLLEDYIKDHPISLESLDIEFRVAYANETLVKNYSEALRGYQRIVDTQQNTKVVHEAYYRMGFVYREGYANYQEAVRNWEILTGTTYYNNDFADQAQFAIAYTYESYTREYAKARAAYNKLLSTFPNSSLQNDARTALLRIEGK